MIVRIYWTSCVLMVWVLAQLLAVSARGDDCACLAIDAVGSTSTNDVPSATRAPDNLPDAANAPIEFYTLLNAERARRGLQPVIGSLMLEQTAARNNAACQQRGQLGHHVLEGFGQVTAWNMGGRKDALIAWLQSPGHRSLILAPDLTMVGYANAGPWHTASTWQGPPPKQVESRPAGLRATGNESPPVAPAGSVCPCSGCGCGARAPTARRGLLQRLLSRVRIRVSVRF